MAKVYCEDCVFFLPGEPIPFSFGPPETQLQKCLSLHNFKDSNVSPNTLPISTPPVINRFNNCVWFVQKSEETSSSSNV